MVRRYETVFIMTPVLSEDQTKETVSKFKKVIADNGGKVVFEDNWGLRKLAYPIQKKTTGFYHLVEFEGSGKEIERLEIEFRRDERVLRFLTMKMEKHAIAYAEKRRSNSKESSGKAEASA